MIVSRRPSLSYPLSATNGNAVVVTPAPTCFDGMNKQHEISNDPCDKLMVGGRKALEFDCCRGYVQQAAKAKVEAGKSVSIRQCLSDVGFSDEQANNRTMQMRVRREVRKILSLTNPQNPPTRAITAAKSRVKAKRKSAQIPTEVSFERIIRNDDEPGFDDDDVSVLTETSDFFNDCSTSTAASSSSNTRYRTLSSQSTGKVVPLPLTGTQSVMDLILPQPLPQTLQMGGNKLTTLAPFPAYGVPLMAATNCHPLQQYLTSHDTVDATNSRMHLSLCQLATTVGRQPLASSILARHQL